MDAPFASTRPLSVALVAVEAVEASEAADVEVTAAADVAAEGDTAEAEEDMVVSI